MSIRSRRRRVDRAMRAGRTVTFREFVEAFCDLEDTPRGKIVTPQAIERLRRLAADRAALIRDDTADDDAREDDALGDPDPGARTTSDETVWYVVAVGPDARLVEDAPDSAVIRRLPDALFACVPREQGRRLRRSDLPNVHVFSSAAPAMAAFGVFEHG